MFPTLSTPPPAKDWSSVSVVSELTSGVILRTVNHVMEHFQEQMRKLPEVCKSSFRAGVKLQLLNLYNQMHQLYCSSILHNLI